MTNGKKTRIAGVVVTVVLLIALIATACAKPAPTPTPTHEIKVVELRGGQFGVSCYKIALALETIIFEMKHPWLRATAFETIGAAENVTTLCDKLPPEKQIKTLMGTSETTVMQAWEGLKPFKRSYKGEILGVFFSTGALSMICSLDPNAASWTPEDLVGKRIGFPRKTSSLSIRMTAMLKDVWHILDKVKYDYLDWGDCATSLIDGRVDAIVTAGQLFEGKYYTMPRQEELFLTRKVYAMPLPEKHWVALGKVLNQKLSTIEIPAGALGQHQTEPFPCNKVRTGCYWAHRDTDPEIVYEVVKIVADNCKTLGEYLGAHRAPQLERIGELAIAEADFHPGAIKYFKEHGIKIGAK